MLVAACCAAAAAVAAGRGPTPPAAAAAAPAQSPGTGYPGAPGAQLVTAVSPGSIMAPDGGAAARHIAMQSLLTAQAQYYGAHGAAPPYLGAGGAPFAPGPFAGSAPGPQYPGSR
jgi:hypothetical protein